MVHPHGQDGSTVAPGRVLPSAAGVARVPGTHGPQWCIPPIHSRAEWGPGRITFEQTSVVPHTRIAHGLEAADGIGLGGGATETGEACAHAPSAQAGMTRNV